MRGTVIFVTLKVFVVEVGDGLYSIIQLPSIPAEDEEGKGIYARLTKIYEKEPDVEVFNEVQGNLLTEGPAEIRNLSKDKIFNAVIKKAPATQLDVVAVL